MLAKNLAAAERAGKISFQDFSPRVFRKIERGAAFDDARAIHQDVRFAKSFESFREETLQGSAIPNITSDSNGSAGERFDFAGGRFHLFETPGRRYHVCSGSRQAESKDTADAGRSTDDHGSSA
jgi:hypothetical protein